MAKRPIVIAEPLGMLEFDGIARGLEAGDALLKEADVSPVVFRTITPGRYVTLFKGDVESVRMALQRGHDVGAERVIDALFLPAPDAGLVPAIGARARIKNPQALGVIETLSLCSLLVAADAAAKTGTIDLVDIRLGMGLGGKAYTVLTGEVSDVESAVVRGTELAQERGHHLETVVIPRPDPQTVEAVLKPIPPFSDFVI